MPSESKFVARPCRKCGDLILAGITIGLARRVSPGVPLEHARILAFYGHGVVLLRNTITGLWADEYHGRYDPAPDAYLAATHVCGSDFARHLKENSCPNQPTR